LNSDPIVVSASVSFKPEWLRIFAVPTIVAFDAKCDQIVGVQPLGGVFGDWNNVMDLLGWCSPPSRIAIDTDWVVCPHIFAEFSPPMVIPSRCSTIALIALVS
jgi:hypothetical protein